MTTVLKTSANETDFNTADKIFFSNISPMKDKDFLAKNIYAITKL